MGEIRSFLGLVGYYRRFIEGFSILVKPMIALLEKMLSLCGLKSVRIALRN